MDYTDPEKENTHSHSKSHSVPNRDTKRKDEHHRNHHSTTPSRSKKTHVKDIHPHSTKMDKNSKNVSSTRPKMNVDVSRQIPSKSKDNNKVRPHSTSTRGRRFFQLTNLCTLLTFFVVFFHLVQNSKADSTRKNDKRTSNREKSPERRSDKRQSNGHHGTASKSTDKHKSKKVTERHQKRSIDGEIFIKKTDFFYSKQGMF